MRWEKKLSKNAFKNYHYSRGYLRFSLSELFNISPLEVPLIANPGAQPVLTNNNGYISLSHCDEILLIAWAPFNIGVDVENKNRIFAAEKISKRFFHESEQKELNKIDKSLFPMEVLKYWTIKEAAYKWQKKKEKTDFLQWESIQNFSIAVNKKINLIVNTYLVIYENFFFGIAYDS